MKSFSAQFKEWSEKVARNLDLIQKDATQTVLNDMSERQPGVGETGGSFVIGKVPVDTGFLINSQLAYINGAPVREGDIDYSLVVSGMELGDVVTGGFSAEYSSFVEYGHANLEGRFFVRSAAIRWQEIMDASVRKFAGA